MTNYVLLRPLPSSRRSSAVSMRSLSGRIEIEEQVVAATKRTEALTQAVLGKAFAGKL